MTPTTVCTSLPSRSSRPMTSRAPAKRRCQTSWPMTTTGAAPGAASASAIGRPMSGGTLATRNPAAEISATAASSTDPSGVMMLRRIVWNAPTSPTDCRLARQRSRSCHVVSRRRPASRSHTWMATTRSPSSSGSGLHMTMSNAANTTAAMPIARVIASPPTSVSPQFLTSRRSPSLTSSHDEPSQGSPRCSRSASSAWMRPPAAARASRAASLRRVALPPELVFSEGKVSGKLALQVMVGPTATERAPYPACPLAKRGADLLERHAGSSKSVCMTDTI